MMASDGLRRAPAVGRLADCNPAYAAVLDAQRAVLGLAVEKLQLTPVHSPVATAAADSVYVVTSQDGSAAAAVQASRGGQVHWLSASALANSAVGFGVTRLLGFVGADSDVPHLVVEQGLLGDKVGGNGAGIAACWKSQAENWLSCAPQTPLPMSPALCLLLQLQGAITLWPRQDWVTDMGYLHRYYNTGRVCRVLGQPAPAGVPCAGSPSQCGRLVAPLGE